MGLRVRLKKSVDISRFGPQSRVILRALKDEGFDINVFDRNTPLTDIVDKALLK